MARRKYIEKAQNEDTFTQRKMANGWKRCL